MFGIFKEALDLFKKMRSPWWRAKKKYIVYHDKEELDEKTIFIESQHGKEMSGNVFYIMRYLVSDERYKDHRILLSTRLGKLDEFRATLERYGLSRVEPVVTLSEEYFKAISSAKYLINDNTFLPFFMKKEGQIYLNTWHGTPLKSLGKQIKADSHAIGNAQRNFVAADYLLFPNDHTRDVMLRDYMVENISSGKCVMSGYPRNEAFFNRERANEIIAECGLEGKRLYAYMPTFRGTAAKGGTSKNTHYLNYYLYELDKQLSDDEIFFVNLHPVAKRDVRFTEFEHIRPFPKGYETYDFLSACEVLVSDYSSVFFDYAACGKKVVLFTYDKDDYLRDRGMYMSIDSLPFPQATDAPSLLSELRTGKSYDDAEFLEKYCKYECADASAKLCDAIILGENTGIEIRDIPNNGKENVLMYCGNLDANGITASMRSLLSTVDVTKRNYYITFRAESVYKNRHVLGELPEGVSYFATADDMNLTTWEQIVRKLFKKGWVKAKAYVKRLGKRIGQAYYRNYAGARFDHVIQFNGYEAEIILQLASAPAKRTIFVHSDMLNEITVRKNQRRDVLEYAYRAYDNVAIVTEDIINPTRKLAGDKVQFTLIKNMIDYKGIRERGAIPLDAPDYQSCTVDFDRLTEILDSDAPKFINVGRFAPEKGQDRLINAFAEFRKTTPDSYLIIMGGNSYGNYYSRIKSQVESMGLSDRVILIMKTPNPYRILAKCDYFVLSSHYEGFGLVLAEADILGKPVISTDITGPRLFMQKHGGTLVENSEAGLLEGMRLLADGKVGTLGVDYEEYNAEIVREFDKMLSK